MKINLGNLKTSGSNGYEQVNLSNHVFSYLWSKLKIEPNFCRLSSDGSNAFLYICYRVSSAAGTFTQGNSIQIGTIDLQKNINEVSPLIQNAIDKISSSRVVSGGTNYSYSIPTGMDVSLSVSRYNGTFLIHMNPKSTFTVSGTTSLSVLADFKLLVD